MGVPEMGVPEMGVSEMGMPEMGVPEAGVTFECKASRSVPEQNIVGSNTRQGIQIVMGAYMYITYIQTFKFIGSSNLH
jgi:hypothetical protein